MTKKIIALIVHGILVVNFITAVILLKSWCDLDVYLTIIHQAFLQKPFKNRYRTYLVTKCLIF